MLHFCQVTTEGMNACLQKRYYLEKPAGVELSNKPYVTDDSKDDFDGGMSFEGRFITAGLLLVVGLLAILATIITINMRYTRRSRRLEYNVLPD